MLERIQETATFLKGKMHTQPETAIILGDISIKSSGVELGFVDRFSGTLIVTGTVSQVEAALSALIKYSSEVLGVTCCAITRT